MKNKKVSKAIKLDDYMLSKILEVKRSLADNMTLLIVMCVASLYKYLTRD